MGAHIRLCDLRCKEVICLKNGIRIGCVDDIDIDTSNAKVNSIVIYGRRRLFGIFGRDDDVVLGWDCIEIIGEDAILVNFGGHTRGKKSKKNIIAALFN
ncbi:MAG: YlmC/YmxH family sporulation protein [Oscillospiraceae bacterium]|nr:YlmC/YmxH family sporulation protein [Oscillospiraceae bacterium]